MTTEIYNSDNVVVRRSMNLRGLLDHARRTPVAEAYVFPREDGGAQVRVIYYNDDLGVATFADRTIAHDWVRARRSWWGKAGPNVRKFLDGTRYTVLGAS